jgi:hypothetical protein
MALMMLAGALAAVAVALFPLEPGPRSSAMLGVAVGTIVGLLAIVIKTQLVALAPAGSTGVQAVLAGQVLTFFLRLLAVGVGALALHQNPLASPVAYVLTFFTVYLAQQFVEVRSLLAARAAKTGVT